jgi:hypothetical protein
VGNYGGNDGVTNILSHEVAESMTDPEGTGITVTPALAGGWNEIGDNEAQNYSAYVNGYKVQSLWSQNQGAFVVDDGNSQSVTDNNGTLTVNGDQFGSGYNDTVTVEENGSGGVAVVLNGQLFSYPYGEITGITVNTGGGTNTVNVLSSTYGTSLSIHGGGTDTVNIGYQGSTQLVQGSVSVNNPPAYTTLNVDDSADPYGGTTSVYDYGVFGQAAPGGVYYTGNDVSALNVNTETGGNTVNVYATMPYHSTSIIGHGPDAVNVGSPYYGGVQAIQGPLYVSNPPSYTTLNVDDTGDATARTATVTNGSVSGLSTYPISYVANDLAALNVTTGSGGDTVSVPSTPWSGVTTIVGGGPDAVRVGNATDGVGDVAGALVVTNNASTTALTVDDSADTTARVASLDTYTGSDGYLYGEVSGLGAAAVSYRSDVVSSVTVNGGGGNTFNVNALTPAPIALNTGPGDDTVYLPDSDGSVTLDGGAGNNTLVGANVDQTWYVSGSNAGSVGVTSFANVQNLTGGSAADTFLIYDGQGVSGLVTGDGSDTLDDSLWSSPVQVDLANGTATGVGGFAGIGSFVGNAASGTLIGPDTPNVWAITGLNTGSVAGVAFSGFANLTGGADTDQFAFGNGSVVGGTVNGGGGDNTLDYSAHTGGAVTVNLAAGTATGTGGVANFDVVIGTPGADHLTGSSAGETFNGYGGADVMAGGGGADVFVIPTNEPATATVADTGSLATILGPNKVNVWAITATDAGNLNGLVFTGIANLTGGASTDTFKIGPSGRILGTAAGGAGVNTLDYSSHGTTAVTFNIANGTATNVTAFSAITSVVGSASTADALTGANVATLFSITGANAGTAGPVKVSGVENLTGGTGNDIFKVNAGASLAGKIAGGVGTDSLNYSAYGSPVTVNLATTAATATGGVSGVESFVGGAGADTLVGPNSASTWTVNATNGGTVNATTFSGLENLTGGTAIDVFKFANGKNVTGSVNGGGGGDWLDYALYTTAVSANLATGAATGVGGTATNIQGVRGGSGANTLTGNAAGNILIGGIGADTINGGSGRSILIGDKGADHVTGGGADDIVIGGYTAFDASSLVNDQALEKILAEWQSANAYATRVSNIKTGAGLTGGNKLGWASTVHDDVAVNVLKGNAGSDWFFKGTHDTIADLQGGEQVN